MRVFERVMAQIRDAHIFATLKAGYKGNALMNDVEQPWPIELRLHKDHKTVTVVFDMASASISRPSIQRVRSQSAEVQGHSPTERKTVPGRRNVAIPELKPIGY